MTEKGQSDYLKDSNPAGSSENETSVLEYLAILLDEWKIVFFTVLIFLLVAFMYSVMTIPQYRAQGVIQVSDDDLNKNELAQYLGSRTSLNVETEIEILKSSAVLGKALTSMSFNIVPQKNNYTLDFNITLREQSPISYGLKSLYESINNLIISDYVEREIDVTFIVNYKKELKILFYNTGQEYSIKPGTTFNKHGVKFSLNETDKLVEGEYQLLLLPNDLMMERARKRFSVEQIGGSRNKTNMVLISFTHEDRVYARDVVNTVMQKYTEFSVKWRATKADKSVAFIENQLLSMKDSLEKSQKDLQKFMEEKGAVMLSSQANELIKGAAALDLELRKINIQKDLLIIVKNELARSKKNGKQIAISGDFLNEDEIIARVVGFLNELELKKQTLLSDMTAAHPDVLRLGKEIESVRGKVLKLVAASKSRIHKKSGAVSRELALVQKKLATFPDKERQLFSLRQSLEVSQDLYKFLMTKLEESRLIKASTITDKRVIDPAFTPYKKNKPRRGMIITTALFIGLITGICLVFLLRFLDPRVQDDEEAKKITRLPVYAVVPELTSIGIKPAQNSSLKAIWEVPKGPAAEAFRTLRTNVEFAQVDQEPIKVVQVTSSEASEGKSTIISNLATALAAAGYKVILVDLDLRRPSQHKRFEMPHSPGITEFLTGRTELKINHIKDYNFHFVSSGIEPPESQRLLLSKKLHSLIDDWKKEYDYILLDTPPLLVADSWILSKLSDMVIFIVRPRVVRRDNLKLARATIKKMDTVKGMVINGHLSRRGGYYHYYRGSYYGSKTSDTQEI